ncbi:peptidoglycan-binding protein [Streptomyces sp. 71268]|uniref:peptidoglycan-binding protein n=1 Tax=Streptomyces sp. 71268 TaxID=3002640 RepID=UPI0023F847EB|nr:peptidoglycan-binding protein [Streptomyces sp. 71268]WEV27622.1 peptidoglycan-binding protein [Streptomyces sp. 71268]
MPAPVFHEYEPPIDCPCAGCVERRRLLPNAASPRAGGHPAAHGARRAMVLVAAAGTVLGTASHGAGAADRPAGPGAPGARTPGAVEPSEVAEGPVAADVAAAAAGALALVAGDAPQGAPGPLYGGGESAPGGGHAVTAASSRTITRAAILARAQRWVDQRVPYSMGGYAADGYRRDCSGFISMAWNLGSNQWTGSLPAFAVRISKSQLEPGDMLLFHNAANPTAGSHVTLFGGWVDTARTRYIAYEQTRPHTVKRSTPYAYWNNSSKYVAYRYRGVRDGGMPGNPGGGDHGTAFPGTRAFGPGAHNAHVTELGRMLVRRGAGKFYASGPGPRWSEADRRATRAFQLAQGWRGAEADGIPGPSTWRYLVTGQGRDVGAGPGSTSGSGSGSTGGHRVPAFPGVGAFRPGQSNAHVEKLGQRLVRKGFGRHYAQGPSRRWTESDRRNVEAFQRAQGWRGADANGYPGLETWRRLFA